MILFSCWIFFGKKLGTQHYPTVVGVGYTKPTYEMMDVGCWVPNNNYAFVGCWEHNNQPTL